MSRWLVSTVERGDPAAIGAVRKLLEAYHERLSVEVGQTSLTAELPTLPAPYAPPGGVLLLARDEQGRPVGCVGVREHSAVACEIKRLYVTPEARGSGLGRVLVRAAIDHARALGYQEMLLVAIEGSTAAAQAIYRSFGFEPTGPFRQVAGDCGGVTIGYWRRSL